MNVSETLKINKIVPVIKLDDSKDAIPLAQALCDGGLPVAEITFRTAAARESIERMTEKFSQMTVGAGTVTTVEQAQQAIDAGATFLVSAGFSHAVVQFAIEKGVPIFPGVCTPTEMMLLLEYGLDVAKFFPASQFGGLDTIKALAAPFPGMKFMPTGGVGPGNIKAYLAFDRIIACGGSWMVKDALIRAGQFDEITRLTAEAVRLVQG